MYNAPGAIVKTVSDAKQLDFFATHPQQEIILPPDVRSDLIKLLSELIRELRDDDWPQEHVMQKDLGNGQDHN